MFSFLLRSVVVMVLAVAALWLYVAWYASTPLPTRTLPVEVEIPKGTHFRDAVAILERAGIDTGGLQFEGLARALGRAHAIKAGSYEFTRALTPLELLDKLTRGDVRQAELRVVEGWTLRQLRQALDASADLRHDSVGMDDEALRAAIGADEARLEGLLFPDTYLFAKGSSDIAVLKRAYRAMKRHLAAEWAARDPRVPYQSPYEAVIMASIVEKETGKSAERDMIAGALVNRLRIGMRLQADPTVIYGLGEAFNGNLKKIHLQTDGPYNTYTRAGLPPTPIALPGLASLRAALRPAQTDALYYVARGDGSSKFSRTLEEHNRAVNRFQRQPPGRKATP
ncbi:MAG: endolytic transglycosylase MltG [Betaproteobacteria bacterium]|nr:endolytic transglycosylase MltG [Betaproteobacteria bacterium]